MNLKLIPVLASLSLLSFGALAQSNGNPTINQMEVAPFGQYNQTFTPGSTFMLFPLPYIYELSDGTTWDSGAGSFKDMQVTLKSVKASGGKIYYFFNPPTGSTMLQYTDYDSGSHSSQGTLKAPALLTLVAKSGSTRGVFKGYTTIQDDTATYYPSFNYYSAPVGAQVQFEVDIDLVGSTFSTSLFNKSFTYYPSGFVNFTSQR